MPALLFAALILVDSTLMWLISAHAPVDARWVAIRLPFIACLVVGVFIALHRPSNRIGWLLAMIGLLAELAFTCDSYAAYGFAIRHGDLPGWNFALWLADLLSAQSYTLMTTFVLLLFPDGRLPSARWRVLGWLTVAMLTTLALTSFKEQPLSIMALTTHPVILNPYPLRDVRWLTMTFDVATFLLLPVSSIGSATAMVWRFRHAHGIVRQQLKWIAYSAAVVAVAACATLVSFVGDLRYAESVAFIQVISFTTIPVVAGIAILRYRLYDIDRIINKTLVYGVLSAILVGTDVLLVLALERLLGSVVSGSSLIVAGSTLAGGGADPPTAISNPDCG